MIGAARASGDLVGFGYGFVGADHTALFHYSQAVVVADELQASASGGSSRKRNETSPFVTG